jgi:hypothetical protein
MRAAMTDLFWFHETFLGNELRWLLVSGFALPLGEISIGIAVLSGDRVGRWQWTLAGVTFLLLLAFALAAYWSGESDCGCFGRVAVRPLQTVVLDALVLLTCVIGAIFQTGGDLPTVTMMGRIASFSGGVWVAVVGATVALEALPKWGLPVRHDVVVRDYPSLVNAEPIDWFEAPLHLRNTSSRQVTIFGGSQSCGVRFAEPIPLTLAGGEYRLLRLRLRSRESAASVRIPIWLYIGAQSGQIHRFAYRAELN